MRFVRILMVVPIRVYRRCISPFTPPTCRFQPSCSAYGEQAILRHGILKGALLTTWRILRCHPFSAPGPDPVPARGRWKSERHVPADATTDGARMRGASASASSNSAPDRAHGDADE